MRDAGGVAAANDQADKMPGPVYVMRPPRLTVFVIPSARRVYP
jgi:hypothetical protein